MARPKKAATPAARATDPATQDEPDTEASEDKSGRDIAPLFAECKTPVYAEDIADITLRRKNRDGRYTTIVMDQVDDEDTGQPFAYDSYKHGEEDIGRVFGPGAYMAIPKDENKKLLGVRFEFELEREIRASKTAVRKLSASDRGFNTGPEAPTKDADAGDEDEGPSEEEIEEMVNARVTAAVAEAMAKLPPAPVASTEDTIVTMMAKEFLKGRNGGPDRLDRGLEVAQHFEKIREASMPAIEDMQTNHAATLKALNARIDSLEKSKQIAEEKASAELEDQRKKFSKERDKLDEAKTEELAALRKKHAKEVEEQEEKLKTERKKAERELEELGEKHKRELRAKGSQEESDKRRLNDEIATLSRRATVLTEDKDSAERSARVKAEEEVRRVREEADKKVKAAETDAELALAKRRKDILAMEEELAAKIKTLEGERDSARKEVLKLSKELADIPMEPDDAGKEEDLYPPGTPKLVKQVAPAVITAGLGYLKEAGEKASREERQKETADREASRARERESAAREREAAAEARARQLERELAEMRARSAEAPVATPAPAPAPAAPAPAPAPAVARAPAPVRAPAPAPVVARVAEPDPAPPAEAQVQEQEPPFIRPAPESSYEFPAPPPPDDAPAHDVAGFVAPSEPARVPERAPVRAEDLAMQTGQASTAGGAAWIEDDGEEDENEEDEAAA